MSIPLRKTQEFFLYPEKLLPTELKTKQNKTKWQLISHGIYSSTANCQTKIPAVLQQVYAIFAARQSFCVVSTISSATPNGVPLNTGWETLSQGFILGLKTTRKRGISLFVGYLGNVIAFPASFFSHYLLKQTSRLKDAKGASKQTNVSKRHVNYGKISGQMHNRVR